MQAKNEMEAIKALSERVPKRIITNGKRNTYYLIGRQNANPSGPANAGQTVLFVSNAEIYQQCNPTYFIVNMNGECSKHNIGIVSGVQKEILTYSNGTYDYIFLYSPNYHDNYFVDVIVNYNITLDLQEMTSSEFSTYVANMTKLSKA